MNQATQEVIAKRKEATCTLYLPTDKLPEHGKARWRQIKPFIPVSRETFRQLELAGRAPRRERLGIRCTFYDLAEVHRWLRDPHSYRTPDAQ